MCVLATSLCNLISYSLKKFNKRRILIADITILSLLLKEMFTRYSLRSLNLFGIVSQGFLDE